MELKLTATKEREDRRIEVYGIGEYEVVKVIRKSGWVSVEVRNNGDRFTPDIHCDISSDGDIEGFSVRTTSYSYISIEEIIEVADKLKVAAEVAKIITQKFVK